MTELTFEIVKCVVIILATLITIYLVPWIRGMAQGTKFEEIETWIEKAVRWAEQTFSSGEGEKKKEAVMSFILELAASKGVRISQEQVDKLIEAAVWAIKQGENA